MRNIAVVLILLLSACSDVLKGPSIANVSIMAHQCAATQLQSPSTAAFSNYGQEQITQLNDSTWMVEGHVDAQNGFGAMIRASFISVVTYRGGMVVCKDVQLFGQR
jgi:hypothetical protein